MLVLCCFLLIFCSEFIRDLVWKRGQDSSACTLQHSFWIYIFLFIANDDCCCFCVVFCWFFVQSSYGIWFENAGIKRTRFTTQFLDAITPPSRQYSYIEYILTFKATARISRNHLRLNFKILSQMPFQNLFWKKTQRFSTF